MAAPPPPLGLPVQGTPVRGPEAGQPTLQPSQEARSLFLQLQLQPQPSAPQGFAPAGQPQVEAGLEDLIARRRVIWISAAIAVYVVLGTYLQYHFDAVAMREAMEKVRHVAKLPGHETGIVPLMLSTSPVLGWSIALGLLVPICGYLGVKQSNSSLMGCFCSCNALHCCCGLLSMATLGFLLMSFSSAAPEIFDFLDMCDPVHCSQHGLNATDNPHTVDCLAAATWEEEYTPRFTHSRLLPSYCPKIFLDCSADYMSHRAMHHPVLTSVPPPPFGADQTTSPDVDRVWHTYSEEMAKVNGMVAREWDHSSTVYSTTKHPHAYASTTKAYPSKVYSTTGRLQPRASSTEDLSTLPWTTKHPHAYASTTKAYPSKVYSTTGRLQPRASSTEVYSTTKRSRLPASTTEEFSTPVPVDPDTDIRAGMDAMTIAEAEAEDDEEGEVPPTPTPMPGDDEVVAPTPTPSPGDSNGLMEAPPTPTPAPGDGDDFAEAAPTPTPAPGDGDDFAEVPPTPTPVPGDRDGPLEGVELPPMPPSVAAQTNAEEVMSTAPNRLRAARHAATGVADEELRKPPWGGKWLPRRLFGAHHEMMSTTGWVPDEPEERRMRQAAMRFRHHHHDWDPPPMPRDPLASCHPAETVEMFHKARLLAPVLLPKLLLFCTVKLLLMTPFVILGCFGFCWGKEMWTRLGQGYSHLHNNNAYSNTGPHAGEVPLQPIMGFPVGQTAATEGQLAQPLMLNAPPPVGAWSNHAAPAQQAAPFQVATDSQE